MKTAALAVLMSAPMSGAATVDFGDFTMDFVDVGDAGNADDSGAISTPYGGVSYAYRMGVNEVSEAMIDAYNTNNAGATISKDTRGANQPAASVSWNEAARFVNWLNTSQGYQAAYNVSGGVNTDITLWSSAQAWQKDGENLYRHKDAHYFLPSEDEWYKAAYYDPDHGGAGVGGYWDFATGSDTAPTAVASGLTGAVYSGQAGPADITAAGGLSPYGTMGQNGNVWEWGESAFTASDGQTAAESRVIRGGYWVDPSYGLRSSLRANGSPAIESFPIGFRVAAVPEPSGLLLTLLGAMGLLMKRRRP